MRNLLKKDNRKIIMRISIAFAFAIIAIAASAASPRPQSPALALNNITVRKTPEGTTATAPSFTRNNVTFLQVAPIFDMLNFRHTTDASANRLTITTERGGITFVNDNVFYSIDTTVAILSHAPALHETKFFLSTQDIIAVLNSVFSGTVTFDARASTLTIAGATATAQTSAPVSRQPAQLDSMSFIRTIVIDPGHGGRDPGAVGPGGTLEKDVTLAISLELQKKLEIAGLTVYMTRNSDVFVPLRDRTNFANEKRADLFVSIHANSIAGEQRRRDSVRGYKIYFLSQAKNEEDKLSAMRENAVIELEDRDTRPSGDMLQDMLISIVGNEFLRESQELSIIMEQTFGATQNKIPRSQLGVGQANFWVLNGAFMPAVLIEAGFISHTNEEKLLADTAVQEQLASALSESIIKFKNMFEGQ